MIHIFVEDFLPGSSNLICFTELSNFANATFESVLPFTLGDVITFCSTPYEMEKIKHSPAVPLVCYEDMASTGSIP